MPTIFEEKKNRIIRQLEVPEDEYSDLSPKGSIDAGIRDLIDEINAIPLLVTTSSCGGRVSVYVEGQAQLGEALGDDNPLPSSGGKGGGRWLYVSHDPVSADEVLITKFGFLKTSIGIPDDLGPDDPLIHFKFEAMVRAQPIVRNAKLTNIQILHILTASVNDTKHLLAAASSAGFRESGAMGLTTNKDGSTTPMVAVRSNGLALDAVVGYVDEGGTPVCIIPEEHLKLLNNIATARFKTNTERIARFRQALLKAYSTDENSTGKRADDYEDADVRRARKKAEGLARQRAIQAEREAENAINASIEST